MPVEGVSRTLFRPPVASGKHGVAASKSAGEILEAVVEDGREGLDRASTLVVKDHT